MGRAVLHELDEQVRADRNESAHIENINKAYNGENLRVLDFQKYKILSENDFLTDDSPWLTASVIVSTNREKHTLNHPICKRFATSRGVPVICWPAPYKGWAQKPSPRHLSEALKDSCFYEYFVAGAPAAVSFNVNKAMGIVNGTQVTCHSIVPVDEMQAEELQNKINSANPGDVITLDRAPACMNIRLEEEEELKKDKSGLTEECMNKWGQYTIVDGQVVIPVRASKKHWDRGSQTKTIVPGGPLYLPSKVNIYSHFPVELSFVITAHKAQGRTLENVILAISERHARGSNMSYVSIYVALSRVKHSNKIRLLLTGRGAYTWSSIRYIEKLRPEKSKRHSLRDTLLMTNTGMNMMHSRPI